MKTKEKAKEEGKNNRKRFSYSSALLLLILFVTLGFVFAQQATKQAAIHHSVGKKIQDVTFVDQQGVSQSLHKIINGRKAFIYFYSGCCKHCHKMLSDVARLTNDFDDDKHIILGIQYAGGKICSLNEQPNKQISGMLITDAGGKICRLFGVGDFTVIIADKNQSLLYRGDFMGGDNIIEKYF